MEISNNALRFNIDRKLISSQRFNLRQELEKLSNIERVYTIDNNFLWIEFINAEEVFMELFKNNIAVSNQSAHIKNSLRIDLGSSEENEKILKILKKFV